jgi:hypothetical protein
MIASCLVWVGPKRRLRETRPVDAFAESPVENHPGDAGGVDNHDSYRG